jgi:hypothetical protein
MSIAAFISIADLYILFFEVAAIAAYGRLEVKMRRLTPG